MLFFYIESRKLKGRELENEAIGSARKGKRASLHRGHGAGTVEASGGGPEQAPGAERNP